MATRSKQKSIARKANKDKRPFATAKYIRISSGKVAIVLDLIRGKNYKEACGILEHTPKAASYSVLKCLKSAAANAEVNQGLDKETFSLRNVTRRKARRSNALCPERKAEHSTL